MKGFRNATALALAAMVMATTACSAGGGDAGGDAGGKVELTFWSWAPGVDKAVELWNSENPDVQVNLEVTPSGPDGTYAKIYSALQAGSGAPDLAQIEYQELPGYVLENGLVDLGPLGMDEKGGEFVDWQLAQSTFADTIYAVPQASGPMGLYYRQDIFDSLGIAVPTTWDEYAEAARTIHAANPEGYITTFPPGNSAWFTSLAWQAGADWFGLDGDTWTVNIDSPETIKVAEYWDGLIAEGVVSTEPDFANGWYSNLQNGNIAAWPSAQWGGALLAGNAPDTAGLWKVAPLPQWDTGSPSANWGGSTTAVLKGTDHAQEAADFAYWLNADPASIDLMFPAGYGWPATTGALESDVINQPEEFFGGQNVNSDVFAPADKSIDNDWGWIPTTSATYAHLNDGFAAALAGDGTLVDVVKSAQQAAIEDLEAKGLKARDGE